MQKEHQSITFFLCLVCTIVAVSWSFEISAPLEFECDTVIQANGTSSFHGHMYYSYLKESVSFTNFKGPLTAVLRFDLMQQFVFAESFCKLEQLYDTGLITFFSVLNSPGLKSLGEVTINSEVCQIYFSPIGSIADGFYLCMNGNVPVQNWIIMNNDTIFLQQFLNVELHPVNSSIFDYPSNCHYNGPTNPPYGIEDDFENGMLQPFWIPPNEGDYVNGAIVVQNEVVRSGKYAVNITVHPGDIRENGGFGKFTERAELDTPMYHVVGREIWYSWSFLLPSDFEIVNLRLVLGQWKLASIDSQSPLIALRFVNGQFYHTVRNLTLHLDDNDEVYFNYGPLDLGKWYDVQYGIFWSSAPDEGSVLGYVNGVLAFQYHGPTLIPGGDYANTHVGLYRDAWNTPWHMFLDDFGISYYRSVTAINI